MENEKKIATSFFILIALEINSQEVNRTILSKTDPHLWTILNGKECSDWTEKFMKNE